MFTVYHGDTFWHKPLTEQQENMLPPGIRETEWAYRPDEPLEWQGLPDLAELIFQHASVRGFDLAASKTWPNMEGHYHSGTPHAFSWVINRIMRNKVVPILPIITNTFFPPNQPRAKRCFEFGEFVAEVVKEWGGDKKIAVFGSGGLSHFAIDEKLDLDFMNAVQLRDSHYLKQIPQDVLMSGTSELRNWISASGIVFGSDLKGSIIDYVPCYRSSAGTGTGQGFICWTST
jgi:OH-DDVA oxygenase/3-O-methylgallate 3,4-dioxygenase